MMTSAVTFRRASQSKFNAGSGMAPIKGEVRNARDVDLEMSNDDLLEKLRHLTKGLINEEAD